jgi:hypothetical protein
MNRAPVTSSTLSAVFYSPDRLLLEIEFRSGDIYRYFDVPPRIYHDLLAAESKGRYFNANIRKRFSFHHIPHSPSATGSSA